MILEEIKKDFPLLENRDIAYLDSGATTQKPKQVIEAIKNIIKTVMQTHIEEHIH